MYLIWQLNIGNILSNCLELIWKLLLQIWCAFEGQTVGIPLLSCSIPQLQYHRSTIHFDVLNLKVNSCHAAQHTQLASSRKWCTTYFAPSTPCTMDSSSPDARRFLEQDAPIPHSRGDKQCTSLQQGCCGSNTPPFDPILYTKTWRHPQNRKYITYRSGWAQGIMNMGLQIIP